MIRLLIVQYAGDYREVVQGFAQGKEETFYAQKYSVDAVAEIAKKVDEVASLCCTTTEAYNEKLENGVRAIGAGLKGKIPARQLINLVEEFQPTHLILRMPSPVLLVWAILKRVKTLPILADSFQTKTLRNKVKNSWIAMLFNHPTVTWVGNCNVPASLILKDIGVNPAKIIPWEWPPVVKPDYYSAKTLRTDTQTWNLVYVGQIIESKGIGDVLEAVKKLKDKNFSVNLKVAGQGELQIYQDKCKELNIENNVQFLGLVGHTTVLNLMREADVITFASRHEYAEGFPKVVVESLCSRTPLIASDHPVFQQILEHETNSLIFSAGDSDDLAMRIAQLLSDGDLYHKLSLASSDTWEKLQIPVKWADLIDRWLFDSPENQQWLYDHSLEKM